MNEMGAREDLRERRRTSNSEFRAERESKNGKPVSSFALRLAPFARYSFASFAGKNPSYIVGFAVIHLL